MLDDTLDEPGISENARIVITQLSSTLNETDALIQRASEAEIPIDPTSPQANLGHAGLDLDDPHDYPHWNPRITSVTQFRENKKYQDKTDITSKEYNFSQARDSVTETNPENLIETIRIRQSEYSRNSILWMKLHGSVHETETEVIYTEHEQRQAPPEKDRPSALQVQLDAEDNDNTVMEQQQMMIEAYSRNSNASLPLYSQRNDIVWEILKQK